jgi:hypothetical protein
MQMISDKLKCLYGKPCWNVKLKHANSITLEFGNPYLEIRKPGTPKSKSSKVNEWIARRKVWIWGEWHLWIDACDWKIIENGKAICKNTSSIKRIYMGLEKLEGQFLINVEVDQENGNTKFYFDLGAIIETKKWDNGGEQWHLYQPDKSVLSIKSDGTYFICRN